MKIIQSSEPGRAGPRTGRHAPARKSDAPARKSYAPARKSDVPAGTNLVRPTVRNSVLVAGILCLIAAGALSGQAQSRPSRSLEQQLMDDLDANPLDPDVQREMRGPEPKAPPGKRMPGEKGRGEAKTLDGLEPQLQRELGDAAVSEDDDPLVDIARQMTQVQGLLSQAKTGPETQAMQTGILASLDELLKAARSQKQQSPSGQSRAKGDAPRRTPNQAKSKPSGQGKPSAQPAQTAKAQPGKQGTPHANIEEMKQVLKRIWGELPEHQREQMLELPVEEFLPKYEWLIEAYFRRLAEDKGRSEE